MNEKQFLIKVIKLYHQARKPLFPKRKISRGRSRSVASDVEDLFASYLVDRIKCNSIYIDQPISIEGRKSRIYPDIVVVKNQQITALCDIKMDLGYKRKELYNFCKRHAKLLFQIRGKKCKIRDGLTKEDKFYRTHKNICLNIVIVSDQNINHRVLADHLEKIKPFSKVIRVFILTTGEHPNTYGVTIPQLLKKITIKKQIFSDLINQVS
jgi:hypothetical protein